MKRLALFLVLLTVPSAAFGQLSDAQRKQIDALFSNLDKPTTPGCIVGIGQNGETLYEHAYGMANLEYDVPLTTTTISEIGSVSKQFTAASILLLEQHGVLSLQDNVRKWIPELPDFGKPITLRMLANHTSGLRDQWGLLSLKNSPPGSAVHSLDVTLDLVTHQRDLNFEPNSQYLYSNTGYALLAVVVQRASGKSLAQFSGENIFRPLGMTHTQWRDDFTRIVKGRATAYDGGGSDGYHTQMPFTNMYGNGGLLTTVGDLLIWWDALQNGRIGGPDFLRKMTTQGVLNDGHRVGYALGQVITEARGVKQISHSGATAGYRANLANFPAQKTTIALLCNTAAAPDVSDRIAQVVLPTSFAAVDTARAAVKAAGMSPDDVRALAGLYVNRNTDDALHLDVRNDRLTAGGIELVPVAGDRLRDVRRGLDVTVRRNRDRVVLEYPGMDVSTVRLERVADATPAAQKLQDYAGSYTSPELEVTYDVVINNGKLVVKRRLMSDVTLSPTYVDAFAGAGNWVFTRDASGRVSGFLYSQGRVRRVRFEKR